MFKTSIKPNAPLLHIVLLIFSLFFSLTPPIYPLHAALRVNSPVIAQEQPPLPGYPIQYTSFGGTTHNLTAYDGKYTRYALPGAWTSPGALTPSQLRRLIDLTDLTYALLSEITSGEPQGTGLLTIAIIPTGANAGHAGSGFKGVELSENELGSVIQNINSDLLSPTVVHELSHNWELFVPYLNLGYPDSSHAWTSFLIPFLQYYSRAGVLESDADGLFEKKIAEYTLAWDSTGATWTQCVRNGNTCPNIQANSAWAGLLLRYTRLHGHDSIKRAFRYLEDYAASHPATGTNPTSPQTREAKNDLLIEALAEGAQRNILCEIDAWHWFATQEARNRISQRFPGADPFCMDTDGDGFTPLAGDTDDTNSQIKPKAIETINNVDDDCDGIVDDLLLTEQADFPSTAQTAPTITIPAKIRGRVTASDADTLLINFTGSLPRHLRLNLQSPNTFVGFIQIQPVDLNGRTQSFSVAGGGAQILTLPRAGLWALTIQNSTSAASDYTLTVEDAGTQTTPVRLKVSPGATSGAIQVSATIDTTRSYTYSPSPNSVRFWLGPSSFVQTTPFQQQLSLSLPIPVGTGPFSLRAQLMSNSTPVSKATLPLWIDRTSGEMLEQTPDLSIAADTTLPTETRAGSNATYGFTIRNSGPGLAQGVEANIPFPSGLNPVSATTTLGVAQITGNNFHLTVNQLAPEESVSFSINTTNLNAQGTITTTATLTASTADPVQSNNSASITGLFTAAPTPTPTPSPTPAPTPTPTPIPNADIQIQSLPAKLQTASTRSVLAQGSLARATIALPGTSLPDSYGQHQNGAWPTTLAGFQVKIASLSAAMIAVKRIPNSDPASYTIDFLVPDTAITGTQVPVTVNQELPLNSWNTFATVRATAPAFWALDGTANGPLLTLDADRLTACAPEAPFPADGTRRLLLFASGAKRLVEQNTLILRITCQSGYQALLVQDFAATLPSLSGLQQVTIRIPAQLAGCGQAQLTIDGAEDNQVFLQIQ